MGESEARVKSHPRIAELMKVISVMGLSHMRKQKHGYDVGWNDLIQGYFATPVMHVLLNVGLLDRLIQEKWVDIHEYARKEDLDPQILASLCESFYCLRILDRQNGRYCLDEKGHLLMEVLRGWLEVSYGYSEIFNSLEEMLRGEKVYGKDFYRRSGFVAKGSGEMESPLFFPLAIDLIAQAGHSRVLDLGCGDGTFLRQLCQSNQEVEGFGIDLSPQAVEEGKVRAKEEGLGDRIQLFARDISQLEKAPAIMQNLDVATIFFVLHELLYDGEEKVIDFLKTYRRIFPDVPLIVFEATRPTAEEMRKKPGMAIYYFLYHDLSHQKPVALHQWEQLFLHAGFRDVDEHSLEFARSAIYVLS